MDELTATRLALAMMSFDIKVCDTADLTALKMAANVLLESIDKHERFSH